MREARLDRLVFGSGWQAFLRAHGGDEMKEVNVEKEEGRPDAIEAIPIPVNAIPDTATLEGLGVIGIPMIRNLAKTCSPNVIFPMIKDLPNDLRQYHRALHSDASFGQTTFWSFAARLCLALQNGLIDTLQAEGHIFLDGEDESSYMVRVLEQKPEKLAMQLAELLARTGGELGGKIFHAFRCSLPQQEASKCFANITASQLQQALIPGYKKRGYSAFTEIYKAKNQTQESFMVNRGGRLVLEPVLDKAETPLIRYDRKRKTDVITYHRELNLLLVHCHGLNDAKLYAEAISTVVGKPMAFVLPQELDLAPFLNKNLGSMLTRVAQTVGIMRLELRKFEVVDTNNMRSVMSAKRWDPCLTEKYHALPAIVPRNTMRFVRLRIVFDAGGKNHVDIDLRNGSLRLGQGLDPMKLAEILQRLEVWRLYANT